MENISELSKYIFFKKKKQLRKKKLEPMRQLIRKCESLLLVIENKLELSYCSSLVFCFYTSVRQGL